MRAMGFRPTEEELKNLLEEIDEDGSRDRNRRILIWRPWRGNSRMHSGFMTRKVLATSLPKLSGVSSQSYWLHFLTRNWRESLKSWMRTVLDPWTLTSSAR